MFTFVVTAGYTCPMPKEPMVQRTLRVPRVLWEAAQQRAEDKGETVSEAVRRFLERYSR